MNKIKLFFITLIMIFFDKSYSQSQIKGIGDFKIDKTNIRIIDSLANNGYGLSTCKDTYDCSEYSTSGMNIYEMVNDTIESDGSLPFFKEYRKFVIAEYNIAGIKMTGVNLSFYNNILFDITIKGDSELSEALKEKYKGVLSAKKNQVICTSRFGEYKETETEYKTTYRENENFHAYSFFKIYYNDKCEKKYLTYTSLYNKKTHKLVYSKNQAAEDIFNKKRKLKKLSELNKL